MSFPFEKDILGVDISIRSGVISKSGFSLESSEALCILTYEYKGIKGSAFGFRFRYESLCVPNEYEGIKGLAIGFGFRY